MCVKVIRSDELLTPYSYLTWVRQAGLRRDEAEAGRRPQVVLAGDRCVGG